MGATVQPLAASGFTLGPALSTAAGAGGIDRRAHPGRHGRLSRRTPARPARATALRARHVHRRGARRPSLTEEPYPCAESPAGCPSTATPAPTPPSSRR
ncbi:hypothetical protein LT493_10145 [Streptomyces tricolor]|nr:hypothetical protein [Streptomyces tricolor]